MRWLVLALLATPALADDPVAPAFVEEAAAAGITHAYTGEWEYMVGGGAAVFDCNDDGFEDLFLAGGQAKAAFYLNRSSVGGPLAFQATDSGLELDAVLGAYPLDIDSDGVMDLVVLRQGENVAMRGLGACRFERANEAWGFDGGDAWSAAFAATWERGKPGPPSPSETTSTARKRHFPGGLALTTGCTGPTGPDLRASAPEAQFLRPFDAVHRWNPLARLPCGCRTTASTTKGGSEQMWRIEPGRSPCFTARRTAGSGCASGGWGLRPPT